jgi:hypothetical protein
MIKFECKTLTNSNLTLLGTRLGTIGHSIDMLIICIFNHVYLKSLGRWNTQEHNSKLPPPFLEGDTSRKHGKKEPQSFSHCGSFDHHDLQSVNDWRFVFFGLPTDILRIWPVQKSQRFL